MNCRLTILERDELLENWREWRENDDGGTDENGGKVMRMEGKWWWGELARIEGKWWEWRGNNDGENWSELRENIDDYNYSNCQS